MSAKPKPKAATITKEDPAEQVADPLTDAEALELENAQLKARLAQLELDAAVANLTAVGNRVAAAHVRDGYEPRHLDLQNRTVTLVRRPLA